MKILGSTRGLSLTVCLLVVGCAAGPEPVGETDPRSRPTATSREGRAVLPPAGFGTLRQDAVTVPIRRGDLLIKTTPLDENVIRMTAPDTYQRLHGLAASNRAALEQKAFNTELALFLVSFFSYDANIPFTPEDLLLSSQGLRFRPLAIEPVTAGFNRRRLNQQETQMAIYAYENGMDLEVDLVVSYESVQSATWDNIIPVLQSERVKVIARAGNDGS
jgi:hypothetical protein